MKNPPNGGCLAFIINLAPDPAWGLSFYPPCLCIVRAATSGPLFLHKASPDHALSQRVFIMILISSGCHHHLPSVMQQTVKIKPLYLIPSLSSHPYSHCHQNDHPKAVIWSLLSFAITQFSFSLLPFPWRPLQMGYDGNITFTAPHLSGLNHSCPASTPNLAIPTSPTWAQTLAIHGSVLHGPRLQARAHPLCLAHNTSPIFSASYLTDFPDSVFGCWFSTYSW